MRNLGFANSIGSFLTASRLSIPKKISARLVLWPPSGLGEDHERATKFPWRYVKPRTWRKTNATMELAPPDDDSSGFPRPGSRWFYLEVLADSLVSDDILKGDFVFVDPEAPFIDGKLYVVRIEERVIFRRIYTMGPGRYKLVFIHGEIEVDRSEIEILGRVTGRVREH